MKPWRDWWWNVRARARDAWRRLVCRVRDHDWEASVRPNRVVKDCLRCGRRTTVIWFLVRKPKK